MKKFSIFFVFAVSVLSFQVSAQDLSLDTILSRYYKAVGYEKMRDWKTYVMHGKSNNQGMEFPVTIFMKRNGKMRLEVEIQGNKMLQVLNGETGWSVIPWSGTTDPQDMTADEVKQFRDQADFEGPLYDWKAKGHKVELIGKEDMEGSSVYKIKITRENGNTETYFIESENYIPLKVASVTKYQGNEVEGETYPGNYKEVDGVMMPFSIENKMKGVSVSAVVIDKYEVNTDVDDNLFIKPVKK
jgi:outer membrane lipoprotein-sorting protein